MGALERVPRIAGESMDEAQKVSVDEELGLGGDTHQPVATVSDQDIDALLGKLEQAGVASTATTEPIAAAAPAVVESAPVAPPPQPVPVAQPKAPEPQLISAPYPVANPLAESKPKEKKKKKKKEATDIEDPAWDAAAMLASKPRPPPQQSAASRNSLTDFSGDTQPIRMPEHVDVERSGFSGTNVLPNMPGTGNSQLMTNLLVMLGVCGIEMIVATAANSLVAWMDMYCRLAAVLNMLYDMEVLDREHESAIVDGHAVARGRVGEITMCRDPAERAIKAAELARVKQVQDRRAAYLSVLLVATYVLTISFVMSVSALTKLYTGEEPNENSGWLMICAMLCVIVDQVHKYYGFELCLNDIDVSTMFNNGLPMVYSYTSAVLFFEAIWFLFWGVSSFMDAAITLTLTLLTMWQVSAPLSHATKELYYV